MNNDTAINLGAWRYYRAAKPAGHSSGDDIVPRLGTVTIGDALHTLRALPTGAVDCVITSPPYHLLRRYDAGEDELGTEIDVATYVDRLVGVCDELARVLSPTGSLFLNLGDSFSRGPRYGAPAKSLLLAPERVLVRLIEHGWRLRSKVVWAKPNPMPNSVTDRFSTAWEPLYFLVRAERYYFDRAGVREPHKTMRKPRPLKLDAKYGGARPTWAGPLAGANDGLERTRAEGRAGHPLGKNPGDVWTIPTAAYRGAHFAVFPEALVRRPVLAGCPERVCIGCGVPWQRERRRDHLGAIQPGCGCDEPWRAGRLLDPFMGSGTVAVAAEREDVEVGRFAADHARDEIEGFRTRHLIHAGFELDPVAVVESALPTGVGLGGVSRLASRLDELPKWGVLRL
ncbi:MAG: site-specific DNA-methyltransferase [Sulfitobacter sp.]|nr:site-specific DNA-methyltransferase [Sulfitobacter sp.]